MITQGRSDPAEPLDFDDDGHPDLLLKFRMRDLGFVEHHAEACVEGSVGGVGFAACDALHPRGPHPDPLP